MLTTLLLLGWLTGQPDPQRRIQEFRLARAQMKDRARAFDATLQAELATQQPLPLWAGTYTTGPGLGGATLALAPRAGFLLTTWGCTPDSEEWDYGSVTNLGSGLHLRSSRAPQPSSPAREALLERLARANDMDLVPIAWGQRRYLVSERLLPTFCRNLREGQQGPAFGAYLRSGDDKRAVSGRPRTPDGDLRCLDVDPLSAHITAVLDRSAESKDSVRSVVSHVALDVGAKDGVRPGMRLYFRGTKSPQLMFTVVALRKHTSQAVIEYQPYFADHPRKGWWLSTDWPPKGGR